MKLQPFPGMFYSTFQGLKAGHRCDGSECCCLYYQLLFCPSRSTKFSTSSLFCTIKIELLILLLKSFHDFKKSCSCPISSSAEHCLSPSVFLQEYLHFHTDLGLRVRYPFIKCLLHHHVLSPVLGIGPGK